MKNTKKPILSFTVDLKKWRCGANHSNSGIKHTNTLDINKVKSLGNGETNLLNEDGYKCCLGFAAQQAGYKGKLCDIREPVELKYCIPGLCVTAGMGKGHRNSAFTEDAITINDDYQTTIDKKMKQLIALGKEHNIEVKFKNVPGTGS